MLFRPHLQPSPRFQLAVGISKYMLETTLPALGLFELPLDLIRLPADSGLAATFRTHRAFRPGCQTLYTC